MRWDRATAPLAAVAVILLVCLTSGSGVVQHPASALLGDTTSDIAGVTRGIWVAQREHVNPFNERRDDYSGAPEGIPVSPAVNAVEPVQPAAIWFLSWLFGRVAAINVLLLAALLTTAGAVYLLCRRMLELGRVPAATSAFAAAFNPWMIEQGLAGHVAFLIGAPVIGLMWALAIADRRPSLATGMLTGGMLGVCFLTAAYVGMVAAIVGVVGAILIFIRARGWVDRLQLAAVACIALATTVALLTPGLIVYASNHASTARIASHGVNSGEASGVSLLQYVNPAPHLALLGRLHTGKYSLAFGGVENVVFFGFSTMLLALVAAISFIRRRHRPGDRAPFLILLCIAVVPVAILFSLPPHVSLDGHTLPLPSVVLEHITTYYRVYSRFAIAAGLALAVLAGVTLDAIATRHRRLSWLIAAVVFVELWPGALPSWSTSTRQADSWLAAQPAGIVADYPQPTDQEPAVRLALTQLAYQPNSKQPLYTLLSGGTGGTREAGIRILSRYITDPATPSILAAEHVRYVVLHDDVFRQEGVAPPAAPSALKLLRREPSERIYVLRADTPPADLDTLLEQDAATIALVQGLEAPVLSLGPGLSLPYRRGQESGWRDLRGPATLTLENSDPDTMRAQITIRAVSPGRPRTLDVADGFGRVTQKFTIGTDVTQVTLGPVPLHPGANQVTIRVEQPATSGPDLSIAAPAVQPLADFSVSLASDQ